MPASTLQRLVTVFSPAKFPTGPYTVERAIEARHSPRPRLPVSTNAPTRQSRVLLPLTGKFLKGGPPDGQYQRPSEPSSEGRTAQARRNRAESGQATSRKQSAPAIEDLPRNASRLQNVCPGSRPRRQRPL